MPRLLFLFLIKRNSINLLLFSELIHRFLVYFVPHDSKLDKDTGGRHLGHFHRFLTFYRIRKITDRLVDDWWKISLVAALQPVVSFSSELQKL